MDKYTLVDEIISVPKWYHSVGIDRHHASRIAKRHKERKYTNYTWLLLKFGYKLEEVIWKK